MKVVAFLLLPAAVVAAAATLQPRQVFGINFSGPPLKPVSIRKLPSKFDSKSSGGASSVREFAVWGPFKVQAANGTHVNPSAAALKLDPNSDILTGQFDGVCKGCMILEAKADLATREGAKVDIGAGVYSHHILMADIGKAPVKPAVQAICPDGKPGHLSLQTVGMMAGGGKPSSGAGGAAPMAGGMQHGGGGGGHAKRQLISSLPNVSVFIGQGDEGSAMHFQMPKGDLKSGFYVSPGDKMLMMAEVINYHPEARDVYVSMEYEYLPDLTPRPAEYLDVGIGAIDVSPCSGQTASLRPPQDRPMRYASPPWRIGQDGYLIDIKPHLHDGGINMTLAVNGKEACVSSAVYGGTDGGLAVGGQKWETITAYTPCEKEIKVKTGDNVTIEAWYDLSKHRL